MNQEKIGSFIARSRKSAGLTQAQLAEMLCLTDKAVSRWECGKSMPDSSIMLSLCDILDISVNELLIGEKIKIDERDNKTEELLVEFTKTEKNKNKKIITTSWILTVISLIFFFESALLAAFTLHYNPLALGIIICVSCIVLFVGVFYAFTLEIDAGYYVCQSCSFEFVPSYKEALLALNGGTIKNIKRHLKCPRCKKKTWAKKVMSK